MDLKQQTKQNNWQGKDPGNVSGECIKIIQFKH